MSAPELARIGGDVSARKRVCTDDFLHGYDVQQIRESLLLGDRLAGSGSMELRERLANAGLIELLENLAWKRGYELRGTAETLVTPLPSPVHVSQLSYWPFVDFASNQPRGLIRVPKQFDIAVLVAELAVAYPDNRIMLLGKVRDLKRVHEQLRQLLPCEELANQQLALVAGDRRLRIEDDFAFPRIICCTPTAAADLDSEKCDIVIMYDAFECMHEAMKWPLIQPNTQFKLFGIVRANRVPKPYEQARLHQVFGFQLIDLMGGGRVRRDVHVAWVRHAGKTPSGAVTRTPAVGNGKPTETVNSLSAYTHNHYRNDVISRLAKKLWAGETLGGAKLKDIQKWLRTCERRPLRVTVLVDRLDHGIQLARRLKDWPILAGPKNNLHNLPKSIRRRIKTAPKQWLLGDRQIIVANEAQSFAGCHSDVLIWASGGTAAADLPNHWLFGADDPRRPLLIVDFLDHFADATCRWSFKRLAHYDQRDIFRVGTPAAIGRMERFLRVEGERG